MKKSAFIIFLFVSAVSAHAQPPSGKAVKGSVYGAKTDENNAIEASQLPSILKSRDTAAVKVKAKVLDVCSKKGCWLTFKVNDSTEAFVKMKDYGFFVPLDLIGKTAVLEGKSYIKTTSVEELKHYAEDAKKPKKEIDAITAPKSEIRFMAQGIVVTE